jgi:hypothetical protein
MRSWRRRVMIEEARWARGAMIVASTCEQCGAIAADPALIEAFIAVAQRS